MVDSSSASQSEVDVNNIATDLNNKADRDLVNLSETGEAKFVKTTCPYVVSRTQDSTNNGIVEIWSDGYCVQTGYTGVITAGKESHGGTTVTLSQTYKDSNYRVFCSYKDASADWAGTNFYIADKTTATFYLHTYNFRSQGGDSFYWYTEGYIR